MKLKEWTLGNKHDESSSLHHRLWQGSFLQVVNLWAINQPPQYKLEAPPFLQWNPFLVLVDGMDYLVPLHSLKGGDTIVVLPLRMLRISSFYPSQN